MAGIYLHIPFCKTRCKYCDFFSTTLLNRRDDYTNALLEEIKQRLDYLPSRDIQTIYFGGGTPTQLQEGYLEAIIKTIRKHYNVNQQAEITIEANPGDLYLQRLEAYRCMGINRLSIGIQSFHDDLLQLIGRRHSAQEAKEAVFLAQKAGFTNISIDLIYGLPGQTIEMWKKDVDVALQLNVQHISAYCLIFEEHTALTHMLQNGKISEVDEDTENDMYDYLVCKLQEHGYERYEISNFCKNGYHSRHNSSYWDGTPYIGLGAGAHSYNGKTRQWNIAQIDTYIEGLKKGETYYDVEYLSDTDRYNELVMLSLRTQKGLSLSSLNEKERDFCIKQARQYIDRKLLIKDNDRLYTTLEGTHILNRIIEDLMLDNE